MDTVKLSEFVRDAISEIAFGVHLAKADTRLIAAVVPGALGGESVVEKSYIEFDIAVTATVEDRSTTGKVKKPSFGISVLGAKVGLNGEYKSDEANTVSNLSSNRVSFKIPIFFNAHFRSDITSADEADYVRKLAEERE